MAHITISKNQVEETHTNASSAGKTKYTTNKPLAPVLKETRVKKKKKKEQDKRKNKNKNKNKNNKNKNNKNKDNKRKKRYELGRMIWVHSTQTKTRKNDFEESRRLKIMTHFLCTTTVFRNDGSYNGVESA